MKVDDFSFLLGLFAADGNLDYGRVRFFCSEEELHFFKNVVKPMVERTFNIKPTIRYFNTHCYLLSINSRKIEKLFRSIFDYSGPKKDNLKLPKIKFDDKGFVAGLISGDGCITITKNGSKKHKYPVLQFVNSSKVLIDFFSNFLKRYGISFYKYLDKNKSYRITVKGGELKKFLNIVPILNPIQKTKLEALKILGYLPPYTTYKDRVKIMIYMRQ